MRAQVKKDGVLIPKKLLKGVKQVGFANAADIAHKVLARFDSTLEAWPVIIATVESGRSPRTLSLDMVDVNGCTLTVSAGPRLERFARLANGGPHPNDRWAEQPVTEG